VSPRISIGASLGYEKAGGEINKDLNRGIWSRNILTILASARFYYLNKNSMDLYSSVNLGGAYEIEDIKLNGNYSITNRTLGIAWHVAPVCIQYDFRRVGLFVELGYGCRGVIHAGGVIAL
jgi:hypothetical protein